MSMNREEKQIARIILFECSIFNSDAEIKANQEHPHVVRANRAAVRIAALRASAAPSASPDFESAALALGFQKIDDRWIHSNDDPMFPRRYRSAEAIFNGLFASAAPEEGPSFQPANVRAWMMATPFVHCSEWKEYVDHLMFALSPDTRKAEPVAWSQRPSVFPEGPIPSYIHVSRVKTGPYPFPLYAALAPATEGGGRETLVRKALEAFMQNAPENEFLPMEGRDYTKADWCPHCSRRSEHHQERHDSDCPYEMGRAALSHSPSVGTKP